jgi:N-acetylmuramoyl-L-alanine amidase
MRSRLSHLAQRLGYRGVRLVAGLLALSGVVAVAAVSHGQTSAGVLKVRLGGDGHQTRIVLELDRPTRGTVIADGATSDRTGLPKVVVGLAHVDVADTMQGAGAGLVKSWRVDEVGGEAQVHLDLVRPAQIRRRFLLPPGDGLAVYRYIIDVSEDSAPVAVAAAPPVQAKPGQPPRRRPLHIITLPLQPVEPAKKVVVIDAGHGGNDPGAAGQDVHEKTLTLAAADMLRDRLLRTGRYKVVLTRETDAYVPLEARVRIARKANADLFISLHADSGNEPALRGATVYTLSEQGADRADKQVFEKANWIDVDLPGSDASVNRILLDLTQRQTRNRSSTFAELLLDHIQTKVPLLHRSHRDAGFMVLLAPDVPAVLLEMGFITNADDERELLDPVRRSELVDGVAQAIDDYFAKDSRIAAR